MHQNACSKMPLEMGWQHWWCLKEGKAMQEEDKLLREAQVDEARGVSCEALR